MKIGVTLRNMGLESTPALLVSGAQAAEAAGIESIWITDHLAIAPDDAVGSGGRYLDPLVTLAWLAQATERIKLGTGVLIVPYRPALPTAKQIATLAELSAQRLLLGVGVGWMDAEFQALGLNRHARGAQTDATLRQWRDWFDSSQEPAMANGQPFLMRPKPKLPPLLVGGRAPHALQRAIALGDGWLPMAKRPQDIAADVAAYQALAAAAGRVASVTVMTSLPLDDAHASRQVLHEYARLGIDRLVCALSYRTAADYQRQLDGLAQLAPTFS